MNNNTILHAIAISLVSNNGKFSYSQTGEMYSKVSSYQVAKMVGLPQAVVKRSQDLMSRMQKDFSNNLSTRKKSADTPEVNVPQLNLFN